MAARLNRRTVLGASIGLGVGAALAVVASIALVTRGDSVFAKQHVTYAGVIALYLGGGVIAGAIVGALSPLARHDAGVPVIGVAAALPVALASRTLMYGFVSWRTFDTAFVGFLTLLWGLTGSLVYLRGRDGRRTNTRS